MERRGWRRTPTATPLAKRSSASARQQKTAYGRHQTTKAPRLARGLRYAVGPFDGLAGGFLVRFLRGENAGAEIAAMLTLGRLAREVGRTAGLASGHALLAQRLRDRGDTFAELLLVLPEVRLELAALVAADRASFRTTQTVRLVLGPGVVGPVESKCGRGAERRHDQNGDEWLDGHIAPIGL